MAEEFSVIVCNSDITFSDFLKKVCEHQRVLSGAAQNMDLFLPARPLSAVLMQLEGRAL